MSTDPGSLSSGGITVAVKLIDLTVAQVEAIETRSEVGFDQWTSPRTSKAALYGSMLVELGGMTPEAVGALTMAELVERIPDVIDMTGVTPNRATRRAARR